MKVVHYSRGLSEGCCRGTINELKVLRRLAEEPSPAPFLLQPYLGNDLWAWRSKGEYLHIMTEVCMGGDLSFYEGRLSEDMLALVSAEVILGLNHLHRLGIVHHDIKPQNVLVNAAGHCVISDYGGAQFLDRWKRIARVPGSVPILTLPFAAPELVSDNDTAYPTYDRAIDYWSLGATLVSLLMDHALLPDARDMTLHTFRLRRIEKKMQDCEISEKLQGFVIALLEETPSRRPMYPDVCKVPFLRELDWEAVKDQRCPPFTVVKHLGVLAHGFQIDAPPLYETRIPVDFVQRLRQEQLSLVVDNSYDVKAHDAAITSVL
ncbi:kinase-like protein [Pilatotrama ljubarskyi]|nr:kinase-like protein [Pilatotrama ljubarskyi]